MKRFITLTLLIAFISASFASSVFGADGSEIASAVMAGESPYCILVNRAQNTVTVYGVGTDGRYSIPVRAMVCSAGSSGHSTPLGSFSTSDRYEWRNMVDGTWGQYATRFNRSILFHSVCYKKTDPASLITEEYNVLGGFASLGCIRLQVADAKWIYDNCPKGTRVTVFDGDQPGPLGKPAPLVSSITGEKANGWDPTDPRVENPWKQILGDRAGSSSAVNGLPFKDVPVSAWYYQDVRGAFEKGIMRGTGPSSFAPSGFLSYAMALQILYNMSDHKESPENGGPWYSAALEWAGTEGITLPADGPFDPGANIPRQRFALYLKRFYGRETGIPAGYVTPPRGAEEVESFGARDRLTAFADAEDVSPLCLKAVIWAVESDILRGDGEMLLPNGALSRAQAAAMLVRAGKE